eukprot:3624217-Amphidinium_carterae.2
MGVLSRCFHAGILNFPFAHGTLVPGTSTSLSTSSSVSSTSFSTSPSSSSSSSSSTSSTQPSATSSPSTASISARLERAWATTDAIGTSVSSIPREYSPQKV